MRSDTTGGKADPVPFRAMKPEDRRAHPRAQACPNGAGRAPSEAFRLAKDAVLETLWPTRCCVCDVPGSVLCERCRRALSYLDRWQACPRCGAPFGRVQCTECNDVVLAALGRSRYPFDSCASAVVLDDAAHRMVLAWKDGGERRLGAVMARLMARTLPPEWNAAKRSAMPALGAPSAGAGAPSGQRADAVGIPAAVLYVPASRKARTRRGWDHAEQLAAELGAVLGLPSWTPLSPPGARDQRVLGRRDRAANAHGSFRTTTNAWRTGGGQGTEARRAQAPRCVLLVDDVFTTGSTLSAATDALKEAGVATVHCATFARTF